MTAKMNSGSEKKLVYIDLIRGAAVLGVIAVHSSQHVKKLPEAVLAIFNFGQLGVQLFFVASAITLCLSAQNRNESSWVPFLLGDSLGLPRCTMRQ